MAIGRHYDVRMDVPAAPKRAPQQPARVVIADLIAQLFQPRAFELSFIPKRSRTYFGTARPSVAPRIPPVGRDLYPSERLRQTLLARSRYLQGQAD